MSAVVHNSPIHNSLIIRELGQSQSVVCRISLLLKSNQVEFPSSMTQRMFQEIWHYGVWDEVGDPTTMEHSD